MPSNRPMTLIALQRRTARLMIDELTERMHASGYAWAPARHYPVFENIDAGGTRLTVLAARAGITHQAMAQLVYELEEHKIVERIADSSDGRAKLVRLTDEGRERVDVALRHIAAIEDTWTQLWRRSGLAGDPRAALEAALHEVESTDRYSP
jgi:DNA-binding MarR family transcriptional regulator